MSFGVQGIKKADTQTEDVGPTAQQIFSSLTTPFLLSRGSLLPVVALRVGLAPCSYLLRRKP